MAATNPSARDSSSAPSSDTGAGMNHPTVVPTNFDPEDDDRE
ncbi:hypothetical protein ACFO5R_06375 [Halosolutus amylolyticus]|uniref:Uncharacterized protein n=1 Tax=Halosolutus amylolyticus TaxID=2932267 RepID=A0ABD5PM71_9EURY|nr:hypothetical protein [Halosolutus amylolyticus]